MSRRHRTIDQSLFRLLNAICFIAKTLASNCRSPLFERPVWALTAAFLPALLAACGASAPPRPDWNINAQHAAERATQAWLTHQPRAEQQEWAQMRRELARTGQPGLIARGELIRCAARTASLVLEHCAAFESLRADAPVAERAYADYLAGRLAVADTALLPAQHQLAAQATGADQTALLTAMQDPLARLVAASVWLQTGRAGPATLQLAVDTASAQGWSRPLLGWLEAQARYAERGGDSAQASRIRRRMALIMQPLADNPAALLPQPRP